MKLAIIFMTPRELSTFVRNEINLCIDFFTSGKLKRSEKSNQQKRPPQ